MSKDISSQYTKEQNKKNGRKGYGMWKKETVTNISPKNYGQYIQSHNKRGK